MKKLLTVLFALLLVAILMPVLMQDASADTYSGSCGSNLTWTFDPDTGILTISGSGAMADYNSPASQPWASFRTSIVRVELPTGITTVGKYAFLNCTELETINIPNTVTSIGVTAFGNCSNMTDITIPNSVKSIGDSAFLNCTGLNAIPDTLESIGNNAFSGCTGLKSITIAENAIVYSDAFKNCTGIETLTIPCNKSVSSHFQGCTSIKTVRFTEGSGVMVDYIESSSSVLSTPWYNSRENEITVILDEGITHIGNYTFSSCTGLKSVVIPNSVTSIGNGAFFNCSNLTDITIPNGVRIIGGRAFFNCTGLNAIPDMLESIGGGAFSGCTGLKSITIEDTVDVGPDAFKNCTGIESLTIPCDMDARTYFEGCTSIKTVRFTKGSGVMVDYDSNNSYGKSIYSTPWYCSRENEITVILDEGITYIGKHTFYDCAGLKTVIIPSSVTSVGNTAFAQCPNMTDITIPNSVKTIGEGAFASCTGLKAIPDTLESIGKEAFSGCTGLKSVTIAENTDVGFWAFKDCTGIELLTVPCDKPFSQVFQACTSIKTVRLTRGSGVMYNYTNYSAISSPWYYSRDNEISFILDEGITNIGKRAFLDCRGLKSFTIPNSVTSIGEDAFGGCTSLASIVIPKNVERIESWAFTGCIDLTSVLFLGDSPSISKYAFSSADTNSTQIICDVYYLHHTKGWDVTINQQFVRVTLFWHELTNAESIKAELSSDEIGFYITAYGTGNSVKDVVITVNGQTIVTNERGSAKIGGVANGEYLVNFSHPLFVEEAKNLELEKGEVYTIVLMPYNAITSAKVMRTVNGVEEAPVDVLTRKLEIDKDDTTPFTLQVTAAGNELQIAEYWIVQGGKKKKSSTTGLFEGLKASDFSSDHNIYLVILGTNGKKSNAVKTNLIIYDYAWKYDDTVAHGLSAGGKETFKYTFPSSAKIMKGVEYSCSMWDSLPIAVSFEKDKYQIAIGFSKREWNSESGWIDESDWSNFKKTIAGKNVEKAKEALGKYYIDYKENGSDISFGKTKIRFDVWGYLEGSKDSLTGKIVCTLNASYTYEHQTDFAGFPMVIVFDVQGKCSGSYAVTWNDFKDADFEGTIKPSISASLGVGPGIAGVASATVNGRVTVGADLSWTTIGNYQRVYAMLEAYWKIKSIGFEIEDTFLKTTLELDNQNTSDIEDFELNAIKPGDFVLRTRPVAEASALKWHGVTDAQKRGGTRNGSSTVLQASAYSDSCLSIVECGGKQIMFLLVDDQNRSVGDGTKLCYSVYDETTGWSEPVAVEDDGTADFLPTAVAAGNMVYVTWADMNCSMDTLDVTNIEEVVSKLEIKLAEYDPQTGNVTVTTLTNDNAYDTLPQVTENNGTVYVAWVKNANNNMLMNDASNSIWIYNSDTGTATVWAENLESVTEINAAIMDGALTVAYVTDADGDLMTTDDRTLVSLTGAGTATTLAEDKTVAELSSNEGELLWFEENALMCLNEGEPDTETFLGLDQPIYGLYQVLDTANKTYIIFLGNAYSADGETLYIDLFAYVYDKASGKWGSAVQLTSLEKTIVDFEAYENANGQICLIVTASELTENAETGEMEESTSLNSITVNLHSDVVLNDFVYDDVEKSGNDYLLDFTATITNTGTQDTENAISLVLYDESDAVVDTIPVSGALLAGESRMVEGTFHVTTLNATDSSFVVKAVMTGDMDETNNGKELTLARENIVVTMDDYTMTNEFYILTVSVKNEGLFATTPTLECRLDADDGELLFTDAYALEAGETGHAIVKVNAMDTYFSGSVRNLFIQTSGSTNGFFFVLYAPHEHTWTGPEWTWNVDHTEAEALFTCSECLTQETIVATVTKETVDPTEDTTGSITYSATVTGPNGRTYTDGDTIIVSTLPNAEIRGATASFEGKIFINFYLNLPDEVKNDAGAYVLFTGGEGERTQTVASALGRTKDIDGITCYGFTYVVVAKEIRENINLKLYDGNGNIIRLTNAAGTNNYTETGVNYSLMIYANKMLNSATASDTMKALASAVIDYGTAAQIYFEYHHEGLSVSSTVTDVQLSDLEQYKAQFTGTNIVNGVPQLPEGITSRSISALFESDNSFRVYYFYGDQVDPYSYTYQIDGHAATLRENDNGHYIELRNVMSNKLNNSHTFTVSDGTTTYTITASVLTYARSSVANGTEARKNLGKALYLYNIAARNQFGE